MMLDWTEVTLDMWTLFTQMLDFLELPKRVAIATFSRMVVPDSLAACLKYIVSQGVSNVTSNTLFQD